MNRYEGGCTTVVIGKKASATGHVLIGHNEDDDKSIVMVHSVPHEKHEAGEFVTFGDRPGVKIPQVRETAGYIWSEVRRPNGGISFGDSFFNEYGVAVVTNSANPGKAPEDENGSQDPYLATMGLGYGVRRLVAERAKTAREGLDVIIELVEKYGYFSSRTYQIADKDECWAVMLTRGKRLVAKRVPDDEVYFMPNHYTIHTLEPSDKKNFYYTPDIVDFAIKNGWYTPAKPGDYSDFDFAQAYQGMDRPYNMARARNGWGILGFEKEWEDCVAAGNWRPFSFKAHRKYTIEDCKALLRSHYEGRSDFLQDWVAYTDQWKVETPAGGGCGRATSDSLIRWEKIADGWRKGSTGALSGSDAMPGGALRQDPSAIEGTPTQYPRDPHQALDDPYTICCGSTVESTVVDFADDPAATCVYRAWRKPCTNPYVPLFIGNLKVPSSYAWMRRELADATHFDPPAEEFVYDPSTAFWNYENLIWQSELDYGFAHSVFGPDIERIEADWAGEIAEVRAKYEELKAEDSQLAKAYLSEFSDGKARFSLHWVRRTTQRIGKKKYLLNQNVPE